VEDCLEQHPEYAARLRPLLESAARLQRIGRVVGPSAGYRTRARARLASHMQAHPHRRPGLGPFQRLTLSLSVLVLAFVSGGTAFAQQALPGDALYGWKRASEKVWRAFSIDPLGTDLELSQRRAFELTHVLQDPERTLRAAADYQESLVRLQSAESEQTRERIYPFLKGQQEMFQLSGLNVPELDHYLSGISGALPEVEQSPPPAPEESGGTAVPTPTPHGGIELLTPVASPLPPNVVVTLSPDATAIGASPGP
jgi:hypothetical protein